MESFIEYFRNIPTLHRSILIVGGITLFWVLEGIVPLLNLNYKKFKHALPNLFLTVTTIIINVSLAFLLLKTADWVEGNDFGLINWLPEMNGWLYAFLGVLFLDLIGAYLPHLVEHKTKQLWKIHLVHHSDHHVDTTTANRHHPLESFIRFSFTLAGVFIVGAPIWIVMLYQSLSLIFSQFNHANITITPKVDKLLSYVIVSPDMHKVHHHYQLPYTDSNYGNIFSVWDRLFGTYMELAPEKIVYGVDTFFDEEANGKIETLLKQPFQGYRPPTNLEELQK